MIHDIAILKLVTHVRFNGTKIQSFYKIMVDFCEQYRLTIVISVYL